MVEIHINIKNMTIWRVKKEISFSQELCYFSIPKFPWRIITQNNASKIMPHQADMVIMAVVVAITKSPSIKRTINRTQPFKIEKIKK